METKGKEKMISFKDLTDKKAVSVKGSGTYYVGKLVSLYHCVS